MKQIMTRNVQNHLNRNMGEVLTAPLSTDVLQERYADRAFALFLMLFGALLIAQNCLM